MRIYAPLIVLGIFVVVQVLYYAGVFKRYKNKFVPLFVFLGLSTPILIASFLVN